MRNCVGRGPFRVPRNCQSPFPTNLGWLRSFFALAPLKRVRRLFTVVCIHDLHMPPLAHTAAHSVHGVRRGVQPQGPAGSQCVGGQCGTDPASAIALSGQSGSWFGVDYRPRGGTVLHRSSFAGGDQAYGCFLIGIQIVGAAGQKSVL